MTQFDKTKLRPIVFCVAVCLLGVANPTFAQEAVQDPTKDSDVITATMAKIRDVEKLDSFQTENTALKEQNQLLQRDLASLTKNVADLSQQLAQQKELLQRQLLQMPTFTVKSKVIGNGMEMAVLQSGDKTIRIRSNTELSVPVSEGVWVLMRVEKISKDLIELNFPEMSRVLYLYD